MILYLYLFAELLDALFFAEFAYQQGVILFGHDVAVKTLHNHLLLLGGMYQAVFCLKESDVCAYAYVVIGILLALGVQ